MEKKLNIKETFDVAVANHKKRNYKIAENFYNKVLKDKPNHIQTNFFLGILYTETKNYTNAISLFQKTIKIQPKHALAYNNLGMIFAEQGKFVNALLCLKNAIELDPDLTNTRNNLCILLRSLTPNTLSEKEEEEFKNLFLILYKRNDIDHDDIFKGAKNVLFYKKNYKEVLLQKNFQSLLKNSDIQKLINEDLFLLMLQKSLISDERLEQILVQLRKEMLIKHSDNEIEEINNQLDFIISLAEQCFLNEYVYIQSQNEINKIILLESNLEKKEKISELDVAILACYVPLNRSKKIKEMLINYKSKNPLFNDLVKIQIKEILQEEKIKKTIKSHGVISDSVSKKVKKQYEENPYPRWRHIYNNIRINFLLRFQNQIKPNTTDITKIDKFNRPNVLVAGCGTGKHLFIADSYANANILGVDLSLSSLAYAKRKTEEAGLKNIDFLQSDILSLQNLDKKFDVIESVGVIHHMKDPLKGLKILIDLLEPHGFLKIGVYSKVARKHVTEIRKYIKKKNFKSNIKDIRKCRYEILNIKNNELLKKISLVRDFYAVSTVRDLIFHEQEHCFTIQEISEFISKFKLKFLGFTDPFIKNNYFKVYSEDKKNIILKNWINYEKNNPNTFNGMYTFWVKK